MYASITDDHTKIAGIAAQTKSQTIRSTLDCIYDFAIFWCIRHATIYCANSQIIRHSDQSESCHRLSGCHRHLWHIDVCMHREMGGQAKIVFGIIGGFMLVNHRAG